MLTSSQPAHPDIKRLIDDILLENARYKNELRNYYREPLVCPVLVRLPQDYSEALHCVSRNISAAGICLISNFEFELDVPALLEIYRISSNKNSARIKAECRWSKPFGEQYWMSGWKLLSLHSANQFTLV